MPSSSVCGQPTCEAGKTGKNCEERLPDKTPPEVLYCPQGDIWVATQTGSANVSWEEPTFTDDVALKTVINKV